MRKMDSFLLLVLVMVLTGTRQNSGGAYGVPITEQPAFLPRQPCRCHEKYQVWLNALQVLMRLYERDINTGYKPSINMLQTPLQNFSKDIERPYYHSSNKNNSNHNIVPQNYAPNGVGNDGPVTSKSNVSNTDQYVLTTDSQVPLYLDINIHKLDNNVLSQLKKLYQESSFNLFESILKDCIDLYVIIYSRKEPKMEHTLEKISERNKKFIKISNSEIITKLNKSCKQPEFLIGEVFNEFKNSRIEINKAVTVTENNKRILNEMETANDVIVQQPDIAAELIDLNLRLKTIEEKSPFLPLIESNTSSACDELDTTIHSLIDESQDISTTPQNYLAYDRKDSIPSIKEATTDYPFLYQSNEDDFFVTDLVAKFNRHITESPDVLTQGTITERNIFSDEATTKNDTIMTSNWIVQTKQQNNEINTTPISDELVPVKNITEYITEYLLMDSYGLNNSKTGGVHRIEYSEGQYEIPKLINTKLWNESFVSRVQDNENIPNSDLAEGNLVLKNTSITSKAKCSKCEHNETLLSLKTDASKTIEDTLKIRTVVNITGKLYFKFGSDFVPASFVQKPDGQVNIALDMPWFCKSIEEKSEQILDFCNCIKRDKTGKIIVNET